MNTTTVKKNNYSLPHPTIVQKKEDKIYRSAQSGKIGAPLPTFRVIKRNKTHCYYIAFIRWLATEHVSKATNWNLSCQRLNGYLIDDWGMIHVFCRGWDVPFGAQEGRYEYVDRNTFIETTEKQGGMEYWDNLGGELSDLGSSKRMQCLWMREGGLYVFKGVYQQDESTIATHGHTTWRLRFNKFNMNNGALSSHADMW